MVYLVVYSRISIRLSLKLSERVMAGRVGRCWFSTSLTGLTSGIEGRHWCGSMVAFPVMTPIAYWVCAVVTVASAFTSLGFSVATVVSTDGSAQTNAMYASARSVALAIASIVALFDHSRPWLEAIAVTMIVVQLADAVIGLKIHEAMKTYGPAMTALANIAALVWLIE